MAQAALRRRENAPGDLYVDATCIDCDTCRWMAPGVFTRAGRQSAVARQPSSAGERRAALHALLSCPTASIGTLAKAPDLRDAMDDFPLPVAPGVFHCGYHSADSYGATAYLLRHAQGNVLVDCPRYAEPLARRIEALGGARWMLLTHRDDVADHDRWARRFGLRRVLHERELPIPGGTPEVLLEGDAAREVLPGLTAIPVPGHTPGHVVYHWDAPGGPYLFSGDHLAYDDEGGRLEAWPDVCWHDWREQTESMRRLAEVEFAWVLPGHGRRGNLPVARMREEMLRLVGWMAAR